MAWVILCQSQIVDQSSRNTKCLILFKIITISSKKYPNYFGSGTKFPTRSFNDKLKFQPKSELFKIQFTSIQFKSLFIYDLIFFNKFAQNIICLWQGIQKHIQNFLKYRFLKIVNRFYPGTIFAKSPSQIFDRVLSAPIIYTFQFYNILNEKISVLSRQQ